MPELAATLKQWLNDNEAKRGSDDYQYVVAKYNEVAAGEQPAGMGSEPTPVEAPNASIEAEQEETTPAASADLDKWLGDNSDLQGSRDYNYVQNRYLEALEREATEEDAKPKTTIGGSVGGLVRGAGPAAIGAGIGLLGGPAAPITVPAGALVGGMAKPVLDPLVGVLNAGLQKMGLDVEVPNASQGFKYLFDSLGIPAPDTAIEKFTQATAEALSGTGSAIKLGQKGAEMGGKATKGVMNLLAEAPASQAATDVVATSAGEAAAQAGLPAWAQAPISLAAGAATGAATAPKRPISALPDAPSAASAPGSAPRPLQMGEVAEAARGATSNLSFEKQRMQKVLAEQASPDQATLKAAKRLGIEDYLQPDHVTTNQVFREFSQAIKSEVGSDGRALEGSGLIAIGERADSLITDLGGAHDLSTLEARVKGRMVDMQERLEKRSKGLYDRLSKKLDPRREVRAPHLVEFLRERAGDLGGVKHLTPVEKKLFGSLVESTSGEDIKALKSFLEGNPPSRIPEGIEEQLEGLLKSDQFSAARVNYGLLDSLRKELTEARVSRTGTFKDASSGLTKKLEMELLQDQRVIAKQFDALDDFTNARKSVALRKGLERDMAALFGKNLDRSFATALASGIKGLPAGDAKALGRLVAKIPKGMRREVVASGLNTAFGKSAKQGHISHKSFAKWYEGLRNQKESFNAIMSNLPKGAKQNLDDLARVSRGISDALDQRIHTGRLVDFRLAMNGADTLSGTLMDIAKNTAVRSGAEIITLGTTGIPGLGLGMAFTSAIGQSIRGRRDVVKAARKLIQSPEFRELALETGQKGERAASAAFLNQSSFKQFWGKLKNPKNITPAQWLRTTMAAARTGEDEEK